MVNTTDDIRKKIKNLLISKKLAKFKANEAFETDLLIFKS